MKKLISLLLAVSVMVASTCASAAYLSATGQRNPGAWGLDGDAPLGESYANCNTLRDYFNPVQNAAFRPGDVLTFTRGDVVVAEGDVITFICYKRGETTLDNSTVMFIDQQVATGTNFSYSYTIRDNMAEGGYQIDIKVGDAVVDTFYFLVGDPQVEMLTLDAAGTKQYLIQDGVAYYFAAATIGSSEVRFEQVAEKFGFNSANLDATTFNAGAYDVFAATQEGDSATFIFAIGVAGFADESELPKVQAYLDE